MSDTINVPKVGPVKKVYAYGAGGLVAAYVLWRYYQAGSAPAAPTEYQPDSSSVTQSGSGPLTSDRTGNTVDTPDGDAPITTNAQWTMAAQDRLSLAGWQDQTIVQALGKYLSRQPLTDPEALIVRSALAVAGPPPQGGPYTIILVTGGNTTAPKPQVPPKMAAPTVHTYHGDNVILVWGGVAGATAYELAVYGQGSRTLKAQTNYRWTGLRPLTSYRVRIRAKNSKGWGPWSDFRTFKTTKKGT